MENKKLYQKLTVKINLLGNDFVIATDIRGNIYRIPFKMINNRQIIKAHTTVLYVKKSYLDSLDEH